MQGLEGKRGQIIEAAVDEFLERGFAGASMDRVSAKASVSKRTVYNHFESKDALFRAILDILAEQMRRTLEVDYHPGQPIRRQLVTLGWAEGKLMTDPHFMRLARMVMGETMRDPALAAEMNERLAHKETFMRFFRAAKADGSLQICDADRATEQFLGLLKSQGFWPVIFSGEVLSKPAMDQVVESSVDMFLKGYGAG